MGGRMIFSICLEAIYPHLAFENRVSKVASHGFSHVEFWGWRNRNIERLKEQLAANKLAVANFSGHRESSPVLLADRTRFINEIKESVNLAHELNCPNLMVLSDEVLSDGSARISEGMWEEKYLNLYRSLEEAVKITEKKGITLLLEALNTQIDHPRYFLSRSGPALQIVKAIENPYLKMLFDVYHMQIAEGNVSYTLSKYMDLIGYVHLADVPGRHEPGTGELNMAHILEMLRKRGFQGGVGFEFWPSGDDDQALDTIRKLTEKY